MDLIKTYTKEYLKELLSEGVYTVTFFKKNGERRDMNCTLIDEFIFSNKPVQEVKLTEDGIIPPKKVRAESPDTLSVWDIEKSEWRSFIVESVVNVVPLQVKEVPVTSEFKLDDDPMIRV